MIFVFNIYILLKQDNFYVEAARNINFTFRDNYVSFINLYVKNSVSKTKRKVKPINKENNLKFSVIKLVALDPLD